MVVVHVATHARGKRRDGVWRGGGVLGRRHPRDAPKAADVTPRVFFNGLEAEPAEVPKVDVKGVGVGGEKGGARGGGVG